MSPLDAIWERLRDLGWWLRCRTQRRLPPMRVHVVGGIPCENWNDYGKGQRCPDRLFPPKPEE